MSDTLRPYRLLPARLSVHVHLQALILEPNNMGLTEAEDIKKRWQEYTEALYKKDLQDHDVITHLEPDFLESEVRWVLGSITTKKLVQLMELAELLQILKDAPVKVLHSVCQQIWKTMQVATGLEKVSFHSNPKERQC